jgi:hypothetical protein
MKPEDQILALAEMDGWEHHPTEIKECYDPSGNLTYWTSAPEYTCDLNAIVPLVAKWAGQDPKRRSDFSNELHKVSGKRPGTPVNSGGTPVVSDFHKFTGPANEWCEALLRAAGKWAGSVTVNQKE